MTSTVNAGAGSHYQFASNHYSYEPCTSINSDGILVEGRRSRVRIRSIKGTIHGS